MKVSTGHFTSQFVPGFELAAYRDGFNRNKVSQGSRTEARSQALRLNAPETLHRQITTLGGGFRTQGPLKGTKGLPRTRANEDSEISRSSVCSVAVHARKGGDRESWLSTLARSYHPRTARVRWLAPASKQTSLRGFKALGLCGKARISALEPWEGRGQRRKTSQAGTIPASRRGGAPSS